MRASEVPPRLGERLPGTGSHHEAARGSPSVADGGDDLGAHWRCGVPQNRLGSGSGVPWVFLGRAEVRFWGLLDIPRAELGLALRSLGSQRSLESGSAVPQVFSELTELRFWGPPGLLCRLGSDLGGGSSESPQSKQACGCPGPSVSEQTGVPRQGGVAVPRCPAVLRVRAARLRGTSFSQSRVAAGACQDRGPTDFAGTRPRHSRWMPGFLQDFVGNAHLSKGKTTEFAHISELTLALKKAQFFPLTNSDVLRLPRRNYCC